MPFPFTVIPTGTYSLPGLASFLEVILRQNFK
jgi:hypothetical protein